LLFEVSFCVFEDFCKGNKREGGVLHTSLLPHNQALRAIDPLVASFTKRKTRKKKGQDFYLTP
jgi:hypothetical protein